MTFYGLPNNSISADVFHGSGCKNNQKRCFISFIQFNMKFMSINDAYNVVSYNVCFELGLRFNVYEYYDMSSRAFKETETYTI